MSDTSKSPTTEEFRRIRQLARQNSLDLIRVHVERESEWETIQSMIEQHAVSFNREYR